MHFFKKNFQFIDIIHGDTKKRKIFIRLEMDLYNRVRGIFGFQVIRNEFEEEKKVGNGRVVVCVTSQR